MGIEQLFDTYTHKQIMAEREKEYQKHLLEKEEAKNKKKVEEQ